MKFGLPESALDSIVAVLSRHPKIEKAVIFGSRAKGTYRKGSDIDIALSGRALDLAEEACLLDDLDQLMLPYTIDTVNYSRIENPALIDHIDRAGVLLYARSPVDEN